MEHFENNLHNGTNGNSRIAAKKKAIRVVIADDNQPMLAAILDLLTPHFEVLGTAADGHAALEMIERLKPDVAVLDLSMPVKTGIEVAAELQTRVPDVKVVMISAYADESYVRAARDAGVLAYVVKTRMGDGLVSAVESAYAGNEFHSAPNMGRSFSADH